MLDKKFSLSIIVPALNEAANLYDAVKSMLMALEITGIEGEIIIVDDGSTDGTEDISAELARQDTRIKVLHHDFPMGLGRSFWDGIMISSKDAVTWLPGDGENDPQEVIKYLPLLQHVDIIVPFVINKGIRSKRRQFFSKVFLWIINLSFGTSFNYTNGNIIYKKRIFDIVNQESIGFLYQTECLIKAVRSGFSFAEVPIRIRKRLKGQSKAISFKSFKVLFWEYLRLLKYIYISQGNSEVKNISI